LDIPAVAVRAVVEEVPAAAASTTACLAAGSRCLIVDDGSGVAPLLAQLLGDDGVDASLAEAGTDAGSAARATDAVIVIDLGDRGAPEVFDVLAPAVLADVPWLGCVTADDAGRGPRGLLRALHAEFPDRTLRSLRVPPDLAAEEVASWVHEELALPAPVNVRRSNGTRLTTRVSPTDRPGKGNPAIFDSTPFVLVPGGLPAFPLAAPSRLPLPAPP